jgi:hypothetical protein
MSGSILPIVRFGLPTNKYIKWTLGVVGTLFLSGLGTGIWQYIIGPTFHTFHTSTRWVLDLASLGMASYKNGVYQQIATDNPASVGIVTLILALSLYLVVTLNLTTDAFLNMKAIGKKLRKLTRLQSGAPPDTEPEFVADREAKYIGKLRVAMYINSLFLILVLVNQFVSLAKLNYVNSADAHYHQVLRVASRFLGAREKDEVESDFALISKREDYVRVLSKLEGECKAHGLIVPEFSAW